MCFRQHEDEALAIGVVQFTNLGNCEAEMQVPE